MPIDPAIISTAVVGLVASLSTYASQRAISRANILTNASSVRSDMERDAYERARKFDTDTIQRQAIELNELRQENKELYLQVKALSDKVNQLEKIRRYPRYNVD